MPRKASKSKKGPSTGAANGCVKCGLESGRWGSASGYQAHGDTYCCEACAGDLGCTCIGAPEDTRESQFRRGESLGGQAGV